MERGFGSLSFPRRNVTPAQAGAGIQRFSFALNTRPTPSRGQALRGYDKVISVNLSYYKNDDYSND